MKPTGFLHIPILSIALFLANSNVFSQEGLPEDPYRVHRHELSMGIIGGGDVRQNPWTLPGVGYKYHFKNSAIRILIGGSLSQNANGNGGGFGTFQENEIGGVVRAGYQYQVMLGRFMPYLGIDGSYGVYQHYYSDGFQYDNETKVDSYGLSPNFGLGFWISPKLSVMIDTRFDLAYREEVNISTSYNPFSDQEFVQTVKSSGLNTTIAPISTFMVAFHF